LTRWQNATGKEAVLEGGTTTFAAAARDRAAS